MTNDELWQEYLALGDERVREQLIERYAPLVKYVVGRIAIAPSSILDGEDLYGFGTMGLLDALNRFDASRGVKFETYAIQRIRGAIIDAFRQLDIVPRSARRRVREIEDAQALLQQELGRDPAAEELADHLGLSRADLSRAMVDANSIILSLERPLALHDGGDRLTLADTIEDTGVIVAQDEIERHEEHEALIGAIQGLEQRDRLVVSLYYYEKLTLREISEVLGVTESRVCQLHTRAISRLRASLLTTSVSSAAA